MLFTRNQFFVLLFAIVIGPFLGQKLWWLAHSRQAVGSMYFVGHDGLGSQMGISTYPVVLFTLGRDSIEFRGNLNLPYRVGDPIPVRYQKDDPKDARIDRVVCIWGDTLVYALGPFLILLVLFLTPDGLDPLLPKRSRVLLGARSFIKIIRA